MEDVAYFAEILKRLIVNAHAKSEHSEITSGAPPALAFERFGGFEPDEFQLFELGSEIIDFGLNLAKGLEISWVRGVQPRFGIGDFLLHRIHLALGRVQRLLERPQLGVR